MTNIYLSFVFIAGLIFSLIPFICLFIHLLGLYVSFLLKIVKCLLPAPSGIGWTGTIGELVGPGVGVGSSKTIFNHSISTIHLF